MGANGPPAAPQLPHPAAGTWRVWPRAGPRPGPPRLKLGPHRREHEGPGRGTRRAAAPSGPGGESLAAGLGQHCGLQGHVEPLHPGLPWFPEWGHGGQGLSSEKPKEAGHTASSPLWLPLPPRPPWLPRCPSSLVEPRSFHPSVHGHWDSPVPGTGLEPPPLRRLCLGAPRTEAMSRPGVVPSQPPRSNCPAGLHRPRGRVPGQSQPRLFPELGTSPDSGLPESRGMRRQTSSQPAQSRDPHLRQCAGHHRRQAVGGSWSSGPPSLSWEAPCHGGRWLLAVA